MTTLKRKNSACRVLMVRCCIDERWADILAFEFRKFRCQRVHIHAIDIVHRHSHDIRFEVPHDTQGAAVSIFLCQHRIARMNQRPQHQFQCLHGA